MPRKNWTFSAAVLAALEAEATRRLKANEMLMRHSSLGSVSRDLAVACIVEAFGKVRRMTKEELDACLHRADTMT